MSVVDEFKSLEQRVAKRLGELEPLVAEYEQLRTVADRLGVKASETAKSARSGGRAASTRSRKAIAKAAQVVAETADPAAKRTPAKRSTRKSASPSKSKRTPGASRGGKRQEQLLDLVRQNPGITIAEAGKKLSVDPTSLYRPLRSLEADGAVKKSGRELTAA